MSAYPEYVERKLHHVCVWWCQYGGGQIQKSQQSQTTWSQMSGGCYIMNLIDKLIDIQFISKHQLISVMSVDSVLPLNCECVLTERLSILGIFVSWNAHGVDI
jgi:hypothetical protein